MTADVIGIIVCFGAGFVIALVNYFLSRYILLKCPQRYASAAVMRQLLQIVFLVAVYFACEALFLNVWYPLIAAVLGMTVPMVYFTKKLLTLNESLKNQKKEAENDG